MRPVLLSAIVLLARGADAQPVSATAEARLEESSLLAKLAADPRLTRTAAEVDLARAEVVAAGIAAAPSLAYEREAVRSGEGFASDALRLTVPLEISGRRAARRAAASHEVTAMSAEADASRFALTLAALRSFRVAQYERERSELLQAERAALAAAVDVVRKRAAAGDTSGYDLQRIELELTSYDDSLRAGLLALDAARMELGTWVGQPAGIDAAGALTVPPDPTALEAVLGGALEHRPELRAAAARSEGAKALLRAADRAWIPELSLSAGILRQDASADDSSWGYLAGVSLSLPIFDHGQAERARASAQHQRAEATKQILARTIPAALRVRYAALVRAVERARAVEQQQLPRLPQLLRSAEAAYRDGGGNIVELVDAYATARDLRLRALELRRDAHLAQLEFWLVLGRRP
ncbi:MAG: TolC family protein [Myxococcales bacterium]|nr:TolC family protein [Myxococcales bacterium]